MKNCAKQNHLQLHRESDQFFCVACGSPLLFVTTKDEFRSSCPNLHPDDTVTCVQCGKSLGAIAFVENIRELTDSPDMELSPNESHAAINRLSQLLCCDDTGNNDTQPLSVSVLRLSNKPYLRSAYPRVRV